MADRATSVAKEVVRARRTLVDPGEVAEFSVAEERVGVEEWAEVEEWAVLVESAVEQEQAVRAAATA